MIIQKTPDMQSFAWEPSWNMRGCKEYGYTDSWLWKSACVFSEIGTVETDKNGQNLTELRDTRNTDTTHPVRTCTSCYRLVCSCCYRSAHHLSAFCCLCVHHIPSGVSCYRFVNHLQIGFSCCRSVHFFRCLPACLVLLICGRLPLWITFCSACICHRGSAACVGPFL